MKYAASVASAIDTFIDRFGMVTAWTSFALVLVMATNVLLRYLFSTGSVWSQELEWHLLVPISLLGMSYALRHGEHVRVDILFSRYPERTKIIGEIVTSILSLLVCLIVIRLSIPYVLQSWNYSEGSANPGGIPYRYALKALIPIGFALFALQSFAEAIKWTIKLNEVKAL
ncbi:MAG: TRAP transporter small permease subunit [Xanthobacteraceae bacterium]|nr:TRAP transporter small permease subunit [Xanthobacteraceae bacterium]MBX3523469.1 TRAP transporter small permease subunit [Xanthobacteraceae bacterium]MBX3548659.1 TRAP transporter small permease subunit [Xanthobacteraceae bacterium]MCW5673790.1 TRAP transporter small permease subunit [Xanthobacteraceae bacterium]